MQLPLGWRCRCTAALIFAGLLCLCATAGAAAVIAERLEIGLAQRAFSGLRAADVEAVFKTFARTVGVANGYDVEVRVRLFDNVGEARSALAVPWSYDLVLLDSWSFLEVDPPAWLAPSFVPIDQGRVTKPYVLVARADRASSGIAGLKGGSLNLFHGPNANLGAPWLRALLAERGLGSPEVFLDSLTYHTEAMPAVLQVFFGQADAALVPADVFELMTELNPQLGALHTLAASEAFLNAVVCLKNERWRSERLRQDLVAKLADLHLHPAGQQILTLFRVGTLTAFQPQHLDTVRKLHAQSRNPVSTTTGDDR